MTRAARPVGACVAALALIGAALFWAPSSSAASSGDRVVSETPAKGTPNVVGSPQDTRMYAVTKVGDVIVAGGRNFTEVKQGGQTYKRDDLFAFHAGTGKTLKGFAPEFGANESHRVSALAPAPGGNAVFVGGYFGRVNGHEHPNLVKLDLDTGKVVKSFRMKTLNGKVRDLQLHDGKLYVAGDFTWVSGGGQKYDQLHPKMVALDPATGAVEKSFDVGFGGTHRGAVGSVFAFDVSGSGRMVAIGNFSRAGSLSNSDNGVQVDGPEREQIAMLDVSGSSAKLVKDWHTASFGGQCSDSFNTYMRDVAFSPDGSYFAVTATGGRAFFDTLCDSVSKWRTGVTGSDVQPSWVDYTGGDTLLSVAVTGSSIYVGGHQRWLNNPHGSDNAKEGAVSRPGLAALDPSNGLPLRWNPRRMPLGYGVTDLLVTDAGLWMGSDTEWIGDGIHHRGSAYHRGRIAFFPYEGGTTVPKTTTGDLPGDVYLLGGSAGQAGPSAQAAKRLVEPKDEPKTRDGSATPGGSATPRKHPTRDGVKPPKATQEGSTVAYRSYDGKKVGKTNTMPKSGLAGGKIRGAMLVGDTLWYGSVGGGSELHFYKRSFDGEKFGEPSSPDPYDTDIYPCHEDREGACSPGKPSAFYDDIGDVTGMFYTNGRMYYTLKGDPQLHYRYFTPSTAIVGGKDFTVDSGIKWGRARGMFLSGQRLYYATANGNLHRVKFANGEPTGKAKVVDKKHGWDANALFLRATGDSDNPGDGNPGGGNHNPGGPGDDGGNNNPGNPGDHQDGGHSDGPGNGGTENNPGGAGNGNGHGPGDHSGGPGNGPGGSGTHDGGTGGAPGGDGDNAGGSGDGDSHVDLASNTQDTGTVPGLPYTGIELGMLLAVALGSLTIGLVVVMAAGGRFVPRPRRSHSG